MRVRYHTNHVVYAQNGIAKGVTCTTQKHFPEALAQSRELAMVLQAMGINEGSACVKFLVLHEYKMVGMCMNTCAAVWPAAIPIASRCCIPNWLQSPVL